jgi:hypothetical protein
VDDKVDVLLDVLDLEVGEVRVDADGQVGREGPGGGGPGEEGGRRVVDEGEGDGDWDEGTIVQETYDGEGKEE